MGCLPAVVKSPRLVACTGDQIATGFVFPMSGPDAAHRVSSALTICASFLARAFLSPRHRCCRRPGPDSSHWLAICPPRPDSAILSGRPALRV